MNLKNLSIGILEYPHCVNKKLWSIRNLQNVWSAAGADVVQYSDLSLPAPEVDVWFCHLDSTMVSQDFAQFIDDQPNIINGRLKDIRKTSFSEQLIDSVDSPYDGAVIAKSVYNYGGLVDIQLVNRQHGWARFLPKKMRRKFLGLPSDLKANPNYTVYDSVKSVPPDFFSSEHNVVEKFLPERVEEHYALRMTFKLGQSHKSYRIISTEQIVKNKNVVTIEEIETDPRVIQWADEHNVDYGKIDHTLWDGEPVIFDINRTPGISGASYENQQLLANALAPGILDFISC